MFVVVLHLIAALLSKYSRFSKVTHPFAWTLTRFLFDGTMFSMSYPSDPSPELAQQLLALLNRSLQTIWEGDASAYAALTAEDVSFFEWYISPQRIDGLDFHLREILVHRAAVAGTADADELQIEHEILQPRIQVYGDTAIISYTLFVRSVQPGYVRHLSHNESRVFHNFGSQAAPDWKLVHCHKSPVVTAGSAGVVRG